MNLEELSYKVAIDNPSREFLGYNHKIRLNSRKVAFWAVTLSCFLPFIKECAQKGLNAYDEFKRRFRLLLDALYRYCIREKIAYIFEYKYIAIDEGHKFPHVHAVLFSDCRKIKKIIARLWRKQGLGYQEFKGSRKRGNCLFRDIYDLGGWLNYCECFKNKYGSKSMKRRESYHGKAELHDVSISRIEQYRRSGNLSIFAKQVRACF